MRTRYQIALGICVVAIVGVIVWPLLSPLREPVYQGKRLSSWLRGYGYSPVWQFGMRAGARLPSEAQRQKVDAVVHQVGTNAVPTLLRMLRAKDSVLKVKLMDLTRKQHIINIQYTRDGELNYEAGKGFEALGAKANSVVPKVIDIADANVSFDSQYYAMAALRAIGQPGEEALPSLLRAATNANYVLRSYAITALGSLHAEPERVVPVLINALHDADSNVRLDASNALKHIDPRAAAVEGMK